jgi:hypothetical protein
LYSAVAFLLRAAVVLLTKKNAEAPSNRQEEKERKLMADYEAKQGEIAEKWRRVGEEYAPLRIKPRKSDVRVTQFGLAWMPTPR